MKIPDGRMKPILRIVAFLFLQVIKFPSNASITVFQSNRTNSDGFGTYFMDPRKYSTYFDYTSKLNDIISGNLDYNETQRLFRYFRRTRLSIFRKSIYYCLDQNAPFSEILNLAPATNFVNLVTKRNHSLILSIPMTMKGELIPARFQDLYYGLETNAPGTTEDEIDSIRQQISGIILDWSDMGKEGCMENSNFTTEYIRKSNISFTKYAKRIAGVMLGTQDTSARIQVGVAYNAQLLQSSCDFIREQVTHADFVVTQVVFTPFLKSPLTYKAFQDYMEDVITRNHDFLIQLQSNGSMRNIVYMFNLKKFIPNILKTHRKSELKTWDKIALEIIDNSEEAYYPQLHSYIESWQWGKRIGAKNVIIKSFDYMDDLRNSKRYYYSSKFFNTLQHIPYLYLHDGDVSSCALRTILDEHRDNREIILNEYTWKAIVAFDKDEGDLSIECNHNITESTVLKRAHLFVSSGIWAVWNYLNGTIERMLMEHQTAAGITLESIVFSSRDIRYSACGGVCKPEEVRRKGNLPGIINFVDNIKINSNVSIGCLVDFGSISNFPLVHPFRTLNQTVMNECSLVFDKASVIVWQFNMNLFEFSSEYLSFHYNYALKQALFKLIVARQLFKETYLGKEIIIQLLPDESFLNHFADDDELYCLQVYDFYNALMRWTYIHGVRFVLRPLFDLRHPRFGLKNLPRDDGRRAKLENFNENFECLLRRTGLDF